jgi:hypothetical protein
VAQPDLLDALAARVASLDLDDDEGAPHVLLVIDPETGVGPAAGPVHGAVAAMAAAERVQTALNQHVEGAHVRVAVVRLFTPPTEGSERR